MADYDRPTALVQFDNTTTITTANFDEEAPRSPGRLLTSPGKYAGPQTAISTGTLGANA